MSQDKEHTEPRADDSRRIGRPMALGNTEISMDAIKFNAILQRLSSRNKESSEVVTTAKKSSTEGSDSGADAAPEEPPKVEKQDVSSHSPIIDDNWSIKTTSAKSAVKTFGPIGPGNWLTNDQDSTSKISTAKDSHPSQAEGPGHLVSTEAQGNTPSWLSNNPSKEHDRKPQANVDSSTSLSTKPTASASQSSTSGEPTNSAPLPVTATPSTSTPTTATSNTTTLNPDPRNEHSQPTPTAATPTPNTLHASFPTHDDDNDVVRAWVKEALKLRGINEQEMRCWIGSIPWAGDDLHFMSLEELTDELMEFGADHDVAQALAGDIESTRPAT